MFGLPSTWGEEMKLEIMAPTRRTFNTYSQMEGDCPQGRVVKMLTTSECITIDGSEGHIVDYSNTIELLRSHALLCVFQVCGRVGMEGVEHCLLTSRSRRFRLPLPQRLILEKQLNFEEKTPFILSVRLRR